MAQGKNPNEKVRVCSTFHFPLNHHLTQPKLESPSSSTRGKKSTKKTIAISSSQVSINPFLQNERNILGRLSSHIIPYNNIQKKIHMTDDDPCIRCLLARHEPSNYIQGYMDISISYTIKL